MASTKITELTAANTIAVTDVLPFVSDPSGSPTTKKITANNLANSLFSNVQVSIVPQANITYNLGSPSKTWNNVHIRALHANGSVGSNGKILTSNGSITFWSDPTYIVTNVSASYTWTNNHTFDGTVTFTSNIVGTANDSLYLGGVVAASYVQNAGTPANSTATGAAGQIGWDTNSIYVCVSTDYWKKVDLTDF